MLKPTSIFLTEAAETAEGVRLAQLAVQLAPNDSLVLTYPGGHCSGQP